MHNKERGQKEVLVLPFCVEVGHTSSAEGGHEPGA